MDEKCGASSRINFTGSGVTVTDDEGSISYMTPDNFKSLFQKVAALEIQVAALMEMLNQSVSQAQEMAVGMATTYDRRDHQHQRDVKVALKESVAHNNTVEFCKICEMDRITGDLVPVKVDPSAEVAGKATTFNPWDHRHKRDVRIPAGGSVVSNLPGFSASATSELLSCRRSDGIPCECCRLTPPKGYQTPDQKRFICSRCYDKGHRLEDVK